jgi:transcriptional regulator EpsA
MNAVNTQSRSTYWPDNGGRGIDERATGLDPQDAAKFISILAASRLIRRSSDLFAWLKEAQKFLPHQVLIAAWGDFQRWNVKWELVWHLPGARIIQMRGCALDDVLRAAHMQWLRGGREPLMLSAAAVGSLDRPCTCAPHTALRGMRSVLVHGVRDKLSGCDSLYIAFDERSQLAAGEQSRFIALAHLLLCQVDSVWRHLATFRLDALPVAQAIATSRVLELSAREREILVSLSHGRTNHDIAEALAISLFTVKNHLKRIFKKIGVSNRTQAVVRFNQELVRSQLLASAALPSANLTGR